uniref:uncharacterized protein LOC120343327 n=1 Tax=Styela clava TaxID=7725 RepID=UPI00193AD617|nr:uncharacterized protein LOC120343327 [Styela clava]
MFIGQLPSPSAFVPSILRAPTTEEKITDNGTLAISINVPDESNGPVSCLFIIVQGNIEAKFLSLIEKSRMAELSSGRLQDEYIAIALNRNSIRSNLSTINLILGNKKNTTCDASKPNHQQQTNSSDNVYEAYNKRLSNSQTYKIFLVTATPSKDTVLFKVSDELLIEKIVPDTNQNIILGVVAGGILAILFAFGSVYYVRHRNNQKKCKTPETISSISMNVSKKEKTEYVSADTQHHLNASINTYGTIADNGYEEISDRPEWNPYEIAVSQYETVL